MDLYVSPAGDDTHPGTLQKPLATLEKARDVIRRHEDSRPVTVHLRGGNYLLRETLTFAAEDSGTQAAPIIYRAYQDETVRAKGDSPHLPERPEGCCAQMGTVPFFPSSGSA